MNGRPREPMPARFWKQADEYGMSYQSIYRIVRRESWAHVD